MRNDSENDKDTAGDTDNAGDADNSSDTDNSPYQEDKLPKIMMNRWLRIALYFFAIIGILTTGCWLLIASSAF